MSKIFVNQLRPEESINEVFLVSSRQVRPNRNGALYLQMRLSDRTGSLDARMWNVDEGILQKVNAGDYIRVEGVTQIYQGNLQLIVSRFERVAAEEVTPDEYLPLAPMQIDQALNRLAEILRSIQNPHLRALIEVFLLDQDFMTRLAQVPAGINFHHAYPGGLAGHVLALVELSQAVAPLYPMLDRDLLLAGAFLHDVGKTQELLASRELGYSDAGQLVGHVGLGLEMLSQAVGKAEELLGEPFPPELLLRLKHMVVSHHGEYEFGSPRLPMTPEAMALHCLDYLDSRMAACTERLRSDPPLDSPWTSFFPILHRKFFRGWGDREGNREGSGKSQPES